MERILVVEDEPELNRMICDFLTHRGYRTEAVSDGAQALKSVFANPPDIVILDLNIPTLDGIDVARTIRSQTSVPVIIASARSEEEERLAGFEAGADDYVVKPFSLPELAMRIAAVLRRSSGSTTGTDAPEIVVGDLVVNTAGHTVRIAGRQAKLTAAQFAILRTLASSPGRVYSRLQLLESFQRDAFEGYERTIDVHIKNIRKEIEADPHNPRRIVTVWGVGYRLEEET